MILVSRCLSRPDKDLSVWVFHVVLMSAKVSLNIKNVSGQTLVALAK